MTIAQTIERIRKKAKENGMATDHQNQSDTPMTIQKVSYKCDICKDTTWVFVNGVARRCRCYELNKAKNLMKSFGIDIGNCTKTFKNYVPYSDDTYRAKEAGADYFKSFDNIKNTKHNSISFLGQVGSGKTHLSIALALNFLDKGIPVLYMPYRDIITKIKQNMLDTKYYIKEISKYQTVEILLIDDLFKGRISNSDINIMFEIINYRYIKNLPIIISSEKFAEDLLDIDEGISSRIIEMCKDYLIEIRGRENNYRMKEY